MEGKTDSVQQYLMQIDETLRYMTGWDGSPSTAELGEDGSLCGINCQLSQINDTLQQLNKTNKELAQAILFLIGRQQEGTAA